MTFLVEKTFANDRYGFAPEARQCEDFAALKADWEDLAQIGPFEAHEEAGQLVRGEVEVLDRINPETGDTVVARRS